MPYRCRLFVFLTVVVFSSSRAAEPFALQADATHHWYKGNMHTHSLWSDGDNYPEVIATWYREHDYQFLVSTDHNVIQQGERWIDVVKNKGGRKAFDRLNETFPAEWIETRTVDIPEADRKEGEEATRTEVRLKTFDEVFERLAKPQAFLLIQGEEISDRFGRIPIHMCATNTSMPLTPLGGDSVVDVMQRNISAAVSHRERTGEKTLVHLNHPGLEFLLRHHR